MIWYVLEGVRFMKRKVSKMSVATVIMIIISLIAGFNLYRKMSMYEKEADLYKYFNIDKNSKTAAIVLEDRVCKDEKGLIEQDEPYVDLDVLKNEISSQFFWDDANKSMIVTTPNSIINVKDEQTVYTESGNNKDFKKIIMKNANDKRYVSLSFIKAVCRIDCKWCKDPDRLVFNYSFGKKENRVKVKNAGSIRRLADDKSEILKDVEIDENLRVLKEENGYISPSFKKVMSEDGLVGYIRKRYISEQFEEALAMKEESKAPEYKQLTDGNKVCLGWYNASDDSYAAYMKNAASTNVVSPTWVNLKLNTSDGSVNSKTSKNLVNKLHNDGKKVWICVQDFDRGNMDVLPQLYDTLSNTQSRIALEDNILNEVTSSGADGINIDFELVHKKEEGATVPFYIQFLRELKAKCGDKIVLSVDVYVPVGEKTVYKVGDQSKFVDYVVIMAYDEYPKDDGKGNKGSTSSIGWVNTGIKESLEQGVANNKLVIGLPFFALYYLDNNTTQEQKSSIYDLNNEMKKNNATPQWDEEKGQNFVSYNLKNQKKEFWIDDAKSIQNKLAKIQENNLAGVGFWSLGQDTGDLWTPINAYMGAK